MKTVLALLALSLALVPAAQATGNVTVLVKISAGTYLAPGELCPVSVPAGANGAAVLDAAVAARCITSWHGIDYGFDTFVDCIDGVCGHDTGEVDPSLQYFEGTYWEFSVNEHSASTGIGGYHAADLDIFGFTYQDYLAGFADYTVSTLLP